MRADNSHHLAAATQRRREQTLDATWAAICDALRIDCDVEEGRDWTIGVDSSVVRAHQHAAGARHVPARDHAGRKGGSASRANRTGKQSAVPAVG